MDPVSEQQVRDILADALDEIAKSQNSVARFGGGITSRLPGKRTSEMEDLLTTIRKQAKKVRKG